MSRAAGQRVVTLALSILDHAAYRSRTDTVDSVEVRLAIGALWLILSDREPLKAYWHRATNVSPHPWESCRQPYYAVAAALRKEGWDAPVR